LVGEQSSVGWFPREETTYFEANLMPAVLLPLTLNMELSFDAQTS
jgi:hypothetical protein